VACTLILIGGGMVGAAGVLLRSRLLLYLCPWLLVKGIIGAWLTRRRGAAGSEGVAREGDWTPMAWP
jgi:hypothetical protein